jgi:hypothetical protein
VTVELDGKKNGKPRMVSFTVGDNAQAGQFNTFRHGYAGTIYKGQGRTLDQTYLYHSRHMRSAASYVALTRHREHTTIFVARETAADLGQLARQMARVDDRRAAAQFHYEEVRVNERAQPQSESRKPDDERQRKIDAVIRVSRQGAKDRQPALLAASAGAARLAAASSLIVTAEPTITTASINAATNPYLG